MTIALIPGGNCTVPTTLLTVKIESSAPLDVSAFRLYPQEKIAHDDDFVFYGQKNSADNSLILLTEGVESTFLVHLPQLPAQVEKVAFAVTLDNDRVISSLNHLEISVSEGENTLVSGNVDLSNRTEVALILGEIYKRNQEWKFRFISQGFNGGLQPLAEHYGVTIAQETQSSQPVTQQRGVDIQHKPAVQQQTHEPQQNPNDSYHHSGSLNNQGSHDDSRYANPNQSNNAPNPASRRNSGAKKELNAVVDWAKNTFNKGQEALKKEVQRYRNKDFMRSCIAVGVYIAYADGVVQPEEKQKLIQYFELSDNLSVFNPNDIITEFSSVAEKFEFDFELGKVEALKIIGAIRNKPEEARAAIRLGIAIAKSDSMFDENENKALVKICNELGLDSKEFFL